MLLSCWMLSGVADQNHFEIVPSLEMSQGDVSDIYFVLSDFSANKTATPPGRRYIAAPGSTLLVVIKDIDNAVTVSKYATRPFVQDGSIWKLSLNAITDAVAIAGLIGTYALKLTLVEPGTTMPAAWGAGTSYDTGDLVSYLGGMWRSLQDTNQGNIPDDTLVWWQPMSVVSAKTHSGFVSQALSIARITQEF